MPWLVCLFLNHHQEGHLHVGQQHYRLFIFYFSISLETGDLLDPGAVPREAYFFILLVDTQRLSW